MDKDSFALLINTVQRFVLERLVPSEQQVADENKIPDGLTNEIRELGLFGLSIAEEYGGLGLSMEEEQSTTVSVAEGHQYLKGARP